MLQLWGLVSASAPGRSRHIGIKPGKVKQAGAIVEEFLLRNLGGFQTLECGSHSVLVSFLEAGTLLSEDLINDVRFIHCASQARRTCDIKVLKVPHLRDWINQ